MTKPLLQARLHAIGVAVAARPDGLALLALGSCAEPERMDAHSDLDFFVIVAPGRAELWRADLDWLAEPAPIAFAHRNTADGWKVLHDDGVFCEFAVFEPAQLAAIPFAPGQLVWAREGFGVDMVQPLHLPGAIDRHWHAREAMTNLLVGLKRLRRGERMAAWQAITGHAMSNALKALDLPVGDPFDPLRRLEARAPVAAEALAAVAGAPLGTLADSAMTLLSMLETAGFEEPALSAALRMEAAAAKG